MLNNTTKPEPKTGKPLEPRALLQIDCDRQLMVARFSHSGQMLLAGGYDATLRRWKLADDTPTEKPTDKTDGKTGGKTDEKTGEKAAEQLTEVEPVSGHQGWVTCLEVQPGGELVFSADSWGRLQATRAVDGEPTVAWHHAQAHDGWIRSLAVSADGQLVVTAGRDQAIRVWSAADGRLLHTLADQPADVLAVAIHPDKRMLVSGDLFGVLRRFELPDGKCVSEKRFEKMHFYRRLQDVGGLRILRFVDEGRTLICAGGEPQQTGRAIGIPTIHWLDWPSLKIQHTARLGPQNQGFVFDFAWHPDKYWAVVTSGQPGHGQFLLLKPGADKPFFASTKMSNCHSLAIHPDGRMVVTASNRNSQGNGAVRDKQGQYVGNYSPLHVFAPPGAEDMPPAAS